MNMIDLRESVDVNELLTILPYSFDERLDIVEDHRTHRSIVNDEQHEL
jgi:hypothetical protein